jgi:hypothetical protein
MSTSESSFRFQFYVTMYGVQVRIEGDAVGVSDAGALMIYRATGREIRDQAEMAIHTILAPGKWERLEATLSPPPKPKCAHPPSEGLESKLPVLKLHRPGG